MVRAIMSSPWLRAARLGVRLRRLGAWCCVLGLLLVPPVAGAAEPPPGLLFVGLQEQSWRLFIVEGAGKLRQLSTQSEPRAPAYSRDRHKVAYISASGELREIDTRSGEDRLLLRSAQFEPHVSADGHALLYSHVVCAMDCGRIIQEIWQRDLRTGEAEQLTLLNGIARQPFQAPDGAIYFSSNRAGNYHIWRLARKGAAPEQLSEGFLTDEAPVVDRAGSVFFIRRQREGVVLMRHSNAGGLEAVTLPRELKDLRELRISP
jgi:hypothetical protein